MSEGRWNLGPQWGSLARPAALATTQQRSALLSTPGDCGDRAQTAGLLCIRGQSESARGVVRLLSLVTVVPAILAGCDQQRRSCPETDLQSHLARSLSGLLGFCTLEKRARRSAGLRAPPSAGLRAPPSAGLRAPRPPPSQRFPPHSKKSRSAHARLPKRAATSASAPHRSIARAQHDPAASISVTARCDAKNSSSSFLLSFLLFVHSPLPCRPKNNNNQNLPPTITHIHTPSPHILPAPVRVPLRSRQHPHTHNKKGNATFPRPRLLEHAC